MRGYFQGYYPASLPEYPQMALQAFEARYAMKRAKDYKLADGEGLYLLVRASGSKLWRSGRAGTLRRGSDNRERSTRVCDALYHAGSDDLGLIRVVNTVGSCTARSVHQRDHETRAAILAIAMTIVDVVLEFVA